MLGGVDISTSQACVLDPAAAAAVPAAGVLPAGTRTAQAAARAALGVWLGLCLHDAVCHDGLCLTHFGLVWYAPGLQKGTLISVAANNGMAFYMAGTQLEQDASRFSPAHPGFATASLSRANRWVEPAKLLLMVLLVHGRVGTGV